MAYRGDKTMTRKGLGIAVVLAAMACARKPDGADTTHPADTSKSDPAAATPPAVSPPVAASRGDSTAKAPPPPRPAPGGSAASTPSSSATATVRGTIAVTGTDRDRHVIVRQEGAPSINLEGPLAMLVGRASGADVWVSGSRNGRILNVSSFAVRTVDGIPATDGQLVADGDRLVIVTPDGKRQTIANAPPALRQHVGGRVWVSGNLAQGPVAFGVIQDKP